MRELSVPILEAGALVEVLIGISRPERSQRQRHGREVPPPVVAQLLVDTGASHTLVDEGLTRSLQSLPVATTQYHSSSTSGVATACLVYAVQLTLKGSYPALQFHTIEVLATAFLNQPFQGLLGRDVLNGLQMSWRGPARHLVLQYP